MPRIVLALAALQRDARKRWMPLLLALTCGLATVVQGRFLMVGGLMLVQFGLVLLWQPLYRIDGQVGRRAGIGAVVAAILLTVLGEYLFPIWVAVLAGLIASRMSSWRGVWSRRFHLGLLVWLLLLLWLRVVPQLAGMVVTWERVSLVVLGLLWCGLVLIPTRRDGGERRRPPDLMLGLLVMAVAILIGLGAMLLAALKTAPYLAALALVQVVVGGVLAFLAWLWSPHGGFAGLGAMFQAQLLQLGAPFEQWTAQLAAYSGSHDRPEDFLRAACTALTHLPPVVGGEWVCDGLRGRFGIDAPYRASFVAGELELAVYAEGPFPHPLQVQFQLVTELLNQFHIAKARERRLADYVYIEAVHETGARLTHDIKNLLQSLQTLIGASAVTGDKEKLLELYNRQLPEIARRLSATLDRLGVPAQQPEARMDAQTWWAEAAARWGREGVEFTTPVEFPPTLDATLFDTVLDNLLQNARDKQGGGRGLPVCIRAALSNVGGQAAMTVEDDGEAIPREIVRDLFERPVASASGFGLGLLQMRKLATARGYRLTLAENVTGCVRFALVPQTS